MLPIRPTKLINELLINAKSDIPSMIWGGPGVGKSQIAYEVARQLGAKMFELRANLFDPVDVRGGLKIVEMTDDDGKGTGEYRTRYGVPEDYPDTNYQGPVMLFVDELPNASKATQNALLQLILDKKIGTYVLPPQTVIIAAGNRAIDRAAVNEMPTPVKNRFAHYLLEPHIDDWAAWALRKGVDSTLVGFIRFRPELLNKPDSKENAFPTPRSWEMLNRKLPSMGADPESQVLGTASVVGDGVAGEFITFRAVESQMPDIDQIIQHPGTVSVPTETSVLYATCGALAARADDKTFGAILKYADRMQPEYQLITVRDSLSKDISLRGHQAFRAWAVTNAAVLV
jgi:hypothetical protein